MAREEASSFVHFRKLFEGQARTQTFGCLAAWRAALDCVRATRDLHVPRAFMAVNDQCTAHAPFPALDYSEFATRMSSVIERHGDLSMPERVVLRTWKRRAHRASVESQRRTSAGFTPMLRSAA
jgi:hypothetical protein